MIAADQRRQHDLTFLQTASDGDPAVGRARDDLHCALRVLVDRARDAGVLRPDITETDVFLLMCAPVHVTDNLADPPPMLWRRYLAIIFDGLRPEVRIRCRAATDTAVTAVARSRHRSNRIDS